MTLTEPLSIITASANFLPTATLRGPNTTFTASSNQTAVWLLGSGSTLIIEEGATLTSTSIRHTLGSSVELTDPAALVHIRGADSLWDMGPLTDLNIAINQFGVDGGHGELRLEDLATVRARKFLVGTGGRITGSNSTIDADVDLVGGTIAPGLSPGELTIDGDLTIDANSELLFEIGGTTPGSEHDVLRILGAATIEGEIVFRFINGFAPSEGQTFDFLIVSGTTDLTETSYLVQGLASDWEYDITPTAGGFQLLSLNDAQAIPEPSSLSLAAALVAAAMGIGQSRRE